MRPRLSNNRLAEIAGAMSERDGQILQLAYELRIVASRHIEGLVITEGSDLTRARRSRAALARLTELGVLARLDRRIGGVRAGSSSYLYRLSHSGRRLLGLSAGAGWREPGLEFVSHTLAAADLHLELVTAQRAGQIETFHVEHEPAAWRRFTGLGGASQWLKPDLFVQITTAEFELWWFVEIDRGTESLTRVVTKTEQYLAYWRTGIEQRRLGVFPRVAWIGPDQRRADAITGALSRVGDGAESLSLATDDAHAVATLGNNNQIEYPKGGQP